MVLLMASLACSLQAGVPPTPTAPARATATARALPSLKNTNIPQHSAIVTALRSLNVRAAPGVTNKVIGALWAGNEIRLTGKCDSGWAQIEWDGQSAWVKASYLSDNRCQK